LRKENDDLGDPTDFRGSTGSTQWEKGYSWKRGGNVCGFSKKRKGGKARYSGEAFNPTELKKRTKRIKEKSVR